MMMMMMVKRKKGLGKKTLR